MELVGQRVVDGSVLALLEQFLKAGVLEELKCWQPTERGTLTRRTTELSDAGGPAHPHWQLTWPARVRSSDLVSHLSCPSSPMGCPSFLWRVLCHRP